MNISWNVRCGLQWALRQKRWSGTKLGEAHRSLHFWLLSRSSLSTLHTCYRFIPSYEGNQVGVLWSSCRAELRCFYGLMPLISGDWAASWSVTVHTSDASGQGYGVCTGDSSVNVVAVCDRMLECPRYRAGCGQGVRARTLRLWEWLDPLPGEPYLEEAIEPAPDEPASVGFEEVPVDMVKGRPERLSPRGSARGTRAS
jgi:hypothetical protein